jgi:hypothetical protein
VRFRGANFILFCNLGFKEMLLMGAHPMFHKKLLMGQSIWLLQKEKVVSAPMI